MSLALLLAAAALLAPEPTAAEVLSRLEVMSFPNSMRPARAPGRVHPADWGFTQPSAEGGWAYLTRPHEGRADWTIGLSIIRREPDAVIACFHDQARNGGSYRAQRALRLIDDGNGGYRAADQTLDEPTCPPYPSQG